VKYNYKELGTIRLKGTKYKRHVIDTLYKVQYSTVPEVQSKRH
jgi:hypothetical protein